MARRVEIANRFTDAVLKRLLAKKLIEAKSEVNAMAALLRGAMGVEGDVELLVLFQRLFPGPPRSRSRRHTAGYARRQA